MDKVRFAIIGCGSIAQSHMKAIQAQPDAEIAVTVDIMAERAEKAAAEFGAGRSSTRAEDVVGDDGVDAVTICLPPSLHRDHAVMAANAGKHVLVEKPMDISLAKCDDMIAAAEANDVRLMVGQVLRFREANVEARRLIREGAIGQPTNVIRRRMSFTKESKTEPWGNDPSIAGGWVLYGFGAHELDMMLWLNDAAPKRTFALGRKTNPYWNDYDDVDILFEMSNGAIGSMTHSVNVQPGAWDCHVAGTEGCLYLTGNKIVKDGEELPGEFDVAGGMQRQIGEFVAAVREGREPEASGRNVRATMQLLEATNLSLAEGRPVEADVL